MAKKQPNQSDLEFLRSIGKCASVDENGYICTLSINHYGRKHKAQVLGGPEDGKELKSWSW